MSGGQLVREARKRAGLTQGELAERLGTTQPVVARWERGTTSPQFRRVVEAIRACGFDLAVNIVTPDDEHRLHIEQNLRVEPVDRLRRLAQSQAAIADLVANVRRQNNAF
ncbi:MAG TPA: helix-turn-helix transcriptional regulator [Actinomycetota bacterium]|nr:helix-turn-helix transcriptional regulator [Actinomycetota bacterium]